MNARRALLMGAPGIVSVCSVNLILDNKACNKIISPRMMSLAVGHPKPDHHASAHDVFCGVVTTIKQAGLQTAFHRTVLTCELPERSVRKHNG